jgi:hypothetical protein
MEAFVDLLRNNAHVQTLLLAAILGWLAVIVNFVRNGSSIKELEAQIERLEENSELINDLIFALAKIKPWSIDRTKELLRIYLPTDNADNGWHELPVTVSLYGMFDGYVELLFGGIDHVIWRQGDQWDFDRLAWEVARQIKTQLPDEFSPGEVRTAETTESSDTKGGEGSGS